MSGNKSSSWHDYNESLIERGRVLIDVGFLKSANIEIKNMNECKVGAPFQYPASYIVPCILKNWLQDSIPYCSGYSTWIIRLYQN